MKVSEDGYLQCGKCGFDYMHLVATIEAHDSSNYDSLNLLSINSTR